MKLKINGEYQDVGFWSFMKCNILTDLVLTGLIYLSILILLFIMISVKGI